MIVCNVLGSCYATRTNLLELVCKRPWQISRLTETFLLMYFTAILESFPTFSYVAIFYFEWERRKDI